MSMNTSLPKHLTIFKNIFAGLSLRLDIQLKQIFFKLSKHISHFDLLILQHSI